jgi:two-component system response regulator RegX3
MSPRILVVDDEPSLVRGLSYALEREGFEVDVATDGEAAVEAATTLPVDLVLLDLGLPVLSGSDACAAIRRQSGIPIIMLTAKDSERDVLQGLEVGADDYVTKPFSAAELLARIAALLRRRELDRQEAEVAYEVGGLRIDLRRDEVAAGDATVALTPSEFKILALLASAPGEPFTRRQVLQHLWGSRHVGDTNTCEVHVSSLRRKLARIGEAHRARIVTVRGVGYALTSR